MRARMCVCCPLSPRQLPPDDPQQRAVAGHLHHTRAHLHVCAGTYECGGLFSAWPGFCHKYLRCLEVIHVLTTADTNHKRWTDVCKCDVGDVNEKKPKLARE